MFSAPLLLLPLLGCDTTSAVDTGARYQGHAIRADSFIQVRGDSDGELAGSSVGGGGDLDGDGIADFAVGAYLSNVKQDLDGRACIFLGPITENTTLTESERCLKGPSSDDYLGRDVEDLGDLDGDGLSELGVGSVHDDEGGPNAGTVVVLWGTPVLAGAPLTQVWGTRAGGHLGMDIEAWPADPPGFVVGAHELLDDRWDGGELRGEGGAYVIHGDLAQANQFVDAVSTRYVGEHWDDRAGVSVEVPGDVDGDGMPDIVVGASEARAPDSEDQVGAIYLVVGPHEAEQSLSDAEAIVRGTGAGEWFGWAIAGVGDADGDGTPDVATSAFKSGANGDDAGAVFIFSGASLLEEAEPEPLATLLGGAPGDKAGEVLESGRDLKGDGALELLIGAPTASHRAVWGGALYAVRGPFEGTRALDADDPHVIGTQEMAFAGSAAAAVGDVTGDGEPDLLLGVMGAKANTGMAVIADGLTP